MVKRDKEIKKSSGNFSKITPANIDLNKYTNVKLPNSPLIVQNPQEIKNNIDKIKKDFEKIKNFIIKKYDYILSISILAPQAIPLFIEENEVPKESENLNHIYIIIPEEKAKEVPEIKTEIIKKITEQKLNIWIQIKTTIEFFEIGQDSKFEMLSAISMSVPIYDKGFLGALRISDIHKSLVLQKFDKYVVSYVIGGSLVRGEAHEESDIDVFVVINDTDVKRMSRIELVERLRAFIYQFVGEASLIAGTKNRLEPQIYLLTDFWEAVKDAHPVVFTFIRDGVPLYDRGTFTPWKTLLRMGKLKPSPEAIEMFMSLGERTLENVKRGMLDIFIREIYWGIVTPSQALLMLSGNPPPAPKHLANEMKKEFFEKEKILEKKYINILEHIIKVYKDFEHEKIKGLSGNELDKIMRESEDYIKRLKELRGQIEEKAKERVVLEMHKEVFDLLKNILGNKNQEKLIEDFEEDFINTGKLKNQSLKNLKKIINVKNELKEGKADSRVVEDARRGAVILMNELTDYIQRKELGRIEKSKIYLKFKEKEKGEILVSGENIFFFEGNKIFKIKDSLEEVGMEEVNKCIEKDNFEKRGILPLRAFEILKQKIGDFEIVL